MMDPGTAVNSPGIAHIIRMIVKNHDLERPPCLHSSDEEKADVMEIPASKKSDIGKADVMVIQRLLERREIVKRATVADRFLPVLKWNTTASRKRLDGIIKIQNSRLTHNGFYCSPFLSDVVVEEQVLQRISAPRLEAFAKKRLASTFPFIACMRRCCK